MKYVIYYRVSTDKQGRSGLGLEAQQKQVNDYLQSKPDAVVVDSYVEVDSGKKVNRIELNKAVDVLVPDILPSDSERAFKRRVACDIEPRESCQRRVSPVIERVLVAGIINFERRQGGVIIRVAVSRKNVFDVQATNGLACRLTPVVKEVRYRLSVE